MSVETRLARESLEDAARHVARFLVLWIVLSVGAASAVLVIGVFEVGGISFYAGTPMLKLLTGATLVGASVNWLSALILTVAWRSSEVSHAR